MLVPSAVLRPEQTDGPAFQPVDKAVLLVFQEIPAFTIKEKQNNTGTHKRSATNSMPGATSLALSNILLRRLGLDQHHVSGRRA